MRQAGGIIALVSGLLALGATFLKMVGDVAVFSLGPRVWNTPEGDMVGFNFANGLLFSCSAIVLGAILIGTGGRPARRGPPWPVRVLLAIGRRIPGFLLIAGSVQEWYYREVGFVVLLFLTLAAIGGIVSLLPDFGAAHRGRMSARPAGRARLEGHPGSRNP